ncbi:MAG: YrhK family protein [Thermoplasmatales archaeon]|nr:YrhK family protein [Thermoplasmatales archaeon]MCW6169717.1 YrhK family protein [Thermoplasmatales archaeon]
MSKSGKSQRAILYNDLISGIMFLVGSILFFLGSFSTGIVLFIIGSVGMVIGPAYKIVRWKSTN